ncbi:DeoR/GlpR family DNA-binding transcription regulator [Paenibacillus radicis (ex Gao et al. 2016)]|uniref:DeoR family transcriptional regulator n=1 Tax=Paenibacillus radicis (ex Gao et al. 2016) TaxID=1737354 RepID=A0A917LX61_9BACL|nr:DeoR/GlpR family DNA-binding transcription regulator [Paenibacillus radicis (ex Gao et al. 2016)]GGG61274.1 DeoR family transcriptional regulator [Paenibacillus radicis (ex Gao et al. 2016)]
MTSEWNDRQRQIKEQLDIDGEVRIADLKERFQVTEMTLRRDLEKLEQSGLIRRTFGGAILLGKDIALKDRTGILAEEKARIGRKAASYIQPGEYIFLDGGTTTIEIARALKPGLAITVVTNALNVASELQEKQIPTIVSGGMILETTSTLFGPYAENLIGSMAYTRVFLGTTGISAQHGFSNSNMYEAEIKKAAIRQATEVTIVADHSKFGAKDFISFAHLGQAHRLITDRLPEAPLLEACKEAGMETIEAS